MEVQLAEYFIEILETLEQLYTVEEFHMRVCNLKDLILENDSTYTEKYFAACLIQGLNSDLKEYVLAESPETLLAAYELASLREKELQTVVEEFVDGCQHVIGGESTTFANECGQKVVLCVEECAFSSGSSIMDFPGEHTIPEIFPATISSVTGTVSGCSLVESTDAIYKDEDAASYDNATHLSDVPQDFCIEWRHLPAATSCYSQLLGIRWREIKHCHCVRDRQRVVINGFDPGGRVSSTRVVCVSWKFTLPVLLWCVRQETNSLWPARGCFLSVNAICSGAHLIVVALLLSPSLVLAMELPRRSPAIGEVGYKDSTVLRLSTNVTVHWMSTMDTHAGIVRSNRGLMVCFRITKAPYGRSAVPGSRFSLIILIKECCRVLQLGCPNLMRWTFTASECCKIVAISMNQEAVISTGEASAINLLLLWHIAWFSIEQSRIIWPQTAAYQGADRERQGLSVLLRVLLFLRHIAWEIFMKGTALWMISWPCERFAVGFVVFFNQNSY